MSNIAIQGAATGTGVFTLASPATNTNRTLTLPDEAGTVLVNGTTSNVGIGTSSPAVRFHVSGSSTYVAGIEGSSAYALMGFKASGTTGTLDDANVAIGANGDALYFRSGGAERMRIDTAGRVTMPYQPAFMAMRTLMPDITSSQTMIFNSAVVNIGNGFNTSNGKFTAPIDGVYEFSFFALHRYKSGNGYVNIYPYKNNAPFLPGNQRIAYSQINQNQEQVVGGVFIVPLAANDTIEIRIDLASSSTDIYGGDINSFCGKLIG